MANICLGSIVFRGKEVKRLFDAVYNGKKENGYSGPSLRSVAETLGVKFEGDGRYYLVTEKSWLEPEKVKVEAELAWNDNRQYFNTIANALGLTWNGFFDTDDSKWKIVNDSAHNDFPEDYILDVYEGEEKNGHNIPRGCEYFGTAEELASYLNKKSGEKKTYDEWQELFEDEDFGKIFHVEEDAA